MIMGSSKFHVWVVVCILSCSRKQQQQQMGITSQVSNLEPLITRLSSALTTWLYIQCTYTHTLTVILHAQLCFGKTATLNRKDWNYNNYLCVYNEH